MVIGLDIGETSGKGMAYDIIDGKPVELLSRYIEIRHDATVDGIVETIRSLLSQIANKAKISLNDLSGIGLSMPGGWKPNGICTFNPNLKAVVGKNISELVFAEIGIPGVTINDGNAGTIGEALLYDATDATIVVVSPGTGLGAGVAYKRDGICRIEVGANGVAHEDGHLSMPDMRVIFRYKEAPRTLPTCGCGKVNCYEAWVSVLGLGNVLNLLAQWEPHSNDGLLLRWRTIDDATEQKEFLLTLRDYAEKGERIAREAFNVQAKILGHMLANMAISHNPDAIIIGGGLSENSQAFRDRYIEQCAKQFDRSCPFRKVQAYGSDDEPIPITWAKGGDGANCLGAALAIAQK